MRSVKAVSLLLLVVLLAGAFSGCGDDGDKPLELYSIAFPNAFITNVSTTNEDNVKRTYLIKAEVTIELTSQSHAEAMNEKLYIAEDAVTGVLRELTLAQLGQANIQEEIKPQIIEKINAAYGIESVHAVYFKSFTVQST
ncbi:flagellar basal body-associated FliL family protein [Oscillospiraceae bacterium OttesenSCG-928-F05]|nr:flagellar basal body-associated FliL family protein [Oscillospiraceae bacterium OttesenSCG-928-F05]